MEHQFCVYINETSIRQKMRLLLGLEPFHLDHERQAEASTLRASLDRLPFFTDVVFLMHSKIHPIYSGMAHNLTENGWDFIRAQIMVRVIKKCSQFITQHRNKCFPICVVDEAICEYSEIENTRKLHKKMRTQKRNIK